MSDEQQARLARLKRWWWFALATASLLVVFVAWAYSEVSAKFSSPGISILAEILAASVTTAMAFFLGSLRMDARQAEQAIAAGRARVREAEREVETALTPRRGTTGGILRPSAREGEAFPEGEEEPEAEDSETASDEGARQDPNSALAEQEEAERAQALARLYGVERIGLEDAQRAIIDMVRQQAARQATEAQREARDLALARLWSLTHRRLDLYHEIATNQARRSFTSAQISMGIGFGLLVLFVVLALNVSDTTGAIVTGGLGAVSAALAGFISKTFVTSQQTAAGHLKAYFDQPLEFSRYLAAERLLADAGLSEEKRAEVVAVLVQTVAAGPAATAPVDAGGAAGQLQDPPA